MLVDWEVPSTPGDKKEIENAIEEAVNSLIRIEAEKDNIKSIYEELKEKHEMPKKSFNDLVRFHFKRNMEEKAKQMEMTRELYYSIFGEPDQDEDEE